ncbi:MAG: A/G-specific adenine glycosylase [Paracoccaceae bacterium]
MRDEGRADPNAPAAGAVGGALLPWYDRHARALPWRVPPGDRAKGVRPDPYRVWLSEIMLQQTTVAAVRDYFRRFTALWPDVAALASAEDARVMAEWAGLGYYARARNLLACARVVARDHGGVFPAARAGLIALPGIGPYTAAAIAAIAHDAPETVVDGNVERVVARLFAVTEALPAAKRRLAVLAATLTPRRRPGDFAQAMMDLGATICTPRKPVCGACPLEGFCAARSRGIAAGLPLRAPKAAKPVRRGVAFVARRADGAWLLETRPAKGLLGGMPGWPGSDWAGTEPVCEPPVAAGWVEAPVGVRHTFTHFHLILRVMAGKAEPGATPARGAFVPADGFSPAHLPSLMRKAFDAARRVLDVPEERG